MTAPANKWAALRAMYDSVRQSDRAASFKEPCPDGPMVHLIHAHELWFQDPGTVQNQMDASHSLDTYESKDTAWMQVGCDFVSSNALFANAPRAEIKLSRRISVQSGPTKADGGAMLSFPPFSDRRWKETPVQVDIDVPLPPDNPGGVPPLPRVYCICFSVPGAEGEHHYALRPAGGATEHITQSSYPYPWPATSLRLLAITPHFEFCLSDGTTPMDLPVRDPWTDSPRALRTEQVYSDARTEWGAGHFKLYERSLNFVIGGYTSYNYRGRTLYGIRGEGGATTSDLAARFSGQLGASRSLVFRAMRDIEGATQTVISYDGPKLSWGINQWNRGELWRILAYIYDFYPAAFERCFARYGLRLTFGARGSTWGRQGASAYTDIQVYRVPCCGPKTRPLLNAALDPDEKRLAQLATVNFGEDTTSYAMHFIFSAAGADPDIQQAQAEWMSFRITSVSPAGKTRWTVVDELLRSLGSNVSPADRLARAQAALSASELTAMGQPFSDDDADPSWIDFGSR